MLDTKLYNEQPYIYYLDSAINILLYLLYLSMCVCVLGGFAQSKASYKLSLHS